jgi:hypothetical protein
MYQQSISHPFSQGQRILLLPSTIERLQLLRTQRRSKKRNEVITVEPGKKTYTLMFEGDSLASFHDSTAQIIRVASPEEAMRYLALLGDSCEIYVSPEYSEAQPSTSAAVRALTYSSARLFAMPDIDDIANILRKVPFDIRSLLSSPLALTENDESAGPIDKSVVHKKNSRNVLISDVFHAGRFMYFNMRYETEEFNFDHDSDHLQGMLILEALRQVSTATVHLAENGLPAGGRISLLQYHANFYNYLTKKAPVIIRTYNTFSIADGEKDKDGYVVSQVFQWGKLCVETILKGQSIKDQERFNQLSRFTEKVSARNKSQFDAKIDLLRNRKACA